MKIFKITPLNFLVLFLASAAYCLSAPPNFESAKITFIQKDVSVADINIVQVSGSGEVSRRKALLQEVVNKNNAIVTGTKSRAELQFNDGTITRLGQLTSFTFTPNTREMNLKEGSGLFQIPKGMGGTRIKAGPVTAAITGTTLLIQVLSDRVIIYVYEGSVQVGGNRILEGEVLVIMNNGTTTKTTFDTKKGMETAALFVKFDGAPSQNSVEEWLGVGDRIRNEDLRNRPRDLDDDLLVPEPPQDDDSGGDYPQWTDSPQ
ncbi:MAG: FecR family protein [Blastochloris sp.]|nr:FecR family protein [Blastochloris sp.]